MCVYKSTILVQKIMKNVQDLSSFSTGNVVWELNDDSFFPGSDIASTAAEGLEAFIVTLHLLVC